MITNELFGLTAEELLAVEWIIWWLCSIHPDPLSAPEELYRKKKIASDKEKSGAGYKLLFCDL